MATAHKRITRKALRQPDWFQITTEKAFEIYEDHRSKVIAGIAAVVVLLLAIFGWQFFKEWQNGKAAEQFGAGAGLYRAQKYREAISVFDKVTDYRWSHYATFAYLYQANSYLALNDFNKALTAAQRFVNATSPDSVYRQIGLVTLGYIEEGKGQVKEALQHYSEAERINGAFRERALLGKARISERTGDLKSAIAAYREYVTENPDSPVKLQIAALEAKLASPPAPAK
ncbi:MAG: tetratricopeptide repeat protein [Deltaproteobacteria bacterium]